MTPFQPFFPDHGDPFMPFPANTPRPDDLPGLSPQEIADLPVELLAILQSEIDARLTRDKAIKVRLDGALILRYAARAAEERQAEGKDTGTVRFDDGDFTIVADLPKRIAWDQNKLANMADRIRAAGEDPSEYIDAAFKVADGFDQLFYEQVRRHAGTDASHLYGGWLAILEVWCEQNAVAYAGVPVGTINKHATGKGNASKAMMIDAARSKGYSPTDDNEADAIAILLWAIETQGGAA
jgi:hypothetical protein